MRACPDDPMIARAVTNGASPELEAHLAACATCRASWQGMSGAIELARRIAVRLPSADRREEMRTAILAASALRGTSTPSRPHASRTWLGGLVAAAAAAVLVLVLWPREAPRHAHGTIHPGADARYVITSTSPDEVVTLQDGRIAVDVEPLHPGERFRVVTADSEIEVRGTAFEVTARLGHVTAVRVQHGIVVVTPIGGTMVVLGASDGWAPPAVRTADLTPARVTPAQPAPVAVGPAAAPAAIAAPVAPARAAPPRVGPAEHLASQPAPAAALAPARTPDAIAYDDAWSAMRRGDFVKASGAFARAGILEPDGPLAEDATYWYAVAVARAKQPAQAAFREFLDRYPGSPHAGEASAMLGWLLVETNQRGEAERRFRAALDDASPQVRESAGAGLAALGIR